VDTGTWETFSVNSAGITVAITQALGVIEKSGILDHYWLHVEKLSTRQKASLLRGAKLLSAPVKLIKPKPAAKAKAAQKPKVKPKPKPKPAR
jgi:hypothetical protein